jgi:hypothetical protein
MRYFAFLIRYSPRIGKIGFADSTVNSTRRNQVRSKYNGHASLMATEN